MRERGSDDLIHLTKTRVANKIVRTCIPVEYLVKNGIIIGPMYLTIRFT